MTEWDVGPGRWEQLFADIEAGLTEAERAELAGEVSDRTRREVAALRLSDRLRTAVGSAVTLSVDGEGKVAGILRDVGPDWILLGQPGSQELLVPTAAVSTVAGLGGFSTAPGTEGAVGAKLDFRYALRRVARDRAPVSVRLGDGQRLHGTLDRVGADFVEIAIHQPGEPRRATAVRAVLAVPLAAIRLVRSFQAG